MSSVDSIVRVSGAGIDLSPRISRTATVAASPADATITAVASLTIEGNPFVAEGILLIASVSLTIGANGTSVLTQIRRTGVAGSVIKASGAVTGTAAELVSPTLVGFDTGPTLPGQVYVIALTVAAATAASTVSAVDFVALAI